MWFLEIYFKDGAERMYCRRSQGDVAFLGHHFLSICVDEIVKVVTYYSDGQTVTNELTINP